MSRVGLLKPPISRATLSAGRLQLGCSRAGCGRCVHRLDSCSLRALPSALALRALRARSGLTFGHLQSGRLLEPAAGTGIVTRALSSSLPADVEIVATDLNQSMVDFATAQQRASNVTWQQADALRLSCADQTFDAIVCQFGLMFYLTSRLATGRRIGC